MKIVLLLSGGLDSTTLLYELVSQGHDVVALSILYGQRHAKEVDFASRICGLTGVSYLIRCLPDDLLENMQSSLLRANGVDVPHGHYEDVTMRSTVVPFRNLMFVSVAAATAANLKFDAVAIAAHTGDRSVYPDCRPEFINPLSECLRAGDHTPVKLLAPYLDLTKTDIARKAKTLNVPISMTWTCYEGLDEPCGKCGSCFERKEALDACQ
jgi:7-cyano-7-deazaguanine synthase